MTHPKDLEDLTEEDYRDIARRLKDNLARYRKARGVAPPNPANPDDRPDGTEVLLPGG
jgi:hypothetical protein